MGGWRLCHMFDLIRAGKESLTSLTGRRSGLLFEKLDSVRFRLNLTGIELDCVRYFARGEELAGLAYFESIDLSGFADIPMQMKKISGHIEARKASSTLCVSPKPR